MDAETSDNSDADGDTIGTTQDLFHFEGSQNLDLLNADFDNRRDLGNNLKNDLDLDSDLEGSYLEVRYYSAITAKNSYRAHRCEA